MYKFSINRKVSLYFILWVFVVSINPANSQVLDKKLHLFIGYGIGDINGESWINKNGLIVPGLLGNYNQSNFQNITATYKVKPWSSVGINLSSHNASIWELEDALLYANSKTNTLIIMPVVRLHSPINRQGILNRLQFYAEIAAGGGSMNIDFGHPMVQAIPTQGGTVYLRSESSDILGVKTSVGCQIFLNQLLGVYANYSRAYYKMNGNMILDNTFSGSFFEFGVNIRFVTKKDYYK